MAFLVCLLFRESIGVAITKSFVIFVRKFFVSSNLKFGHSFVRSYNSVSMSLANLIMEIKDPSLFVNGFVQHELNQLANFISTM